MLALKEKCSPFGIGPQNPLPTSWALKELISKCGFFPVIFKGQSYAFTQ